MSIIRNNLMSEQGYSPYCGGISCWAGMPRTKFDGEQFVCRCGWRSQFPADFIAEYKTKWGIDKVQSGEKVCEGCGHAGGGKCPDCGPVMGDATYKAMFGNDAEKSSSRELHQCQHGTILYGSCMLCDREAEQQGGTA